VWRVGLIDSGCEAQELAIVAAGAFVARAGRLESPPPPPATDPTGHGTRIARILAAAGTPLEFVVAQVFDSGGPTSAAAVAAAIDWCVALGAPLLHLSLGLAADRAVLRTAIERALAAGCVVVAATPARGAVAYPAGYGGVIRGTGDARCAPGEIAALDPDTFGGCVRLAADGGRVPGSGASIGAAHVSRALLERAAPGGGRRAAIAALAVAASYHGRERHTTAGG
jgi:subtilisin family serine protease